MVKKISFSADENLIEQARVMAGSQGRTLDDAFRDWLVEFISGAGSAAEVESLMRRLRHVKAGGHFSRREMNEV